MKKLIDLKIQIYADGADLEEIAQHVKKRLVTFAAVNRIWE